MKVALLIAGYLRTYNENVDRLMNEIKSKFGKVDVYLHITKNEKNEDRYLNNIEEKDVESIIKKLQPITTIIEENNYYSDDKNINGVKNHWSKLYRLNEIKKINEKSLNSKYDLVIRYRPDLSIGSENIFTSIEENVVYIPKDSKIDKNRLINKNDGYLCDGFAFGCSKVMDEYFNLYLTLPHMINTYGSVSETLLYRC